MVEVIGTWLAHLGAGGCILVGAPAAVAGYCLRHRARRALAQLRATRDRLRPIGSLTVSGRATVAGRVISVDDRCALLRDPAGHTALVSLRQRVRVGDLLLVDGVASQLQAQRGSYREVRRLWLIDACGDGALVRAPISRASVAARAGLALFGGALFTTGLAMVGSAFVTWFG